MGCSSSKEERGNRYALGQDEDRITGVRPSSTRSKSSNSGPRSSQGAQAGRLSPKTSLSATNGSGTDKRINNYQPKKPKLDPKDYRFIGLRGGVHVKPPGSLNGQAFTIDDCQDCDLYLLDHCAQVNIDDCKNCRIFIGPTAGSIFLRTSTNVKCAMVARQIRLRDVTDSQLSMLCRTRPILESSSKV